MKILKVISRFSDWDAFMKYSTIYFMLGEAVYVIILPFMTKLTAAEISAAGLATYAVIKGANSFILPYVEWVTLKQTFSLARYLGVINIVLIGLYLIYPEYPKVFIYIWWFIGIVGGVLWSIMGIKYDALIGKRKDVDFAEVQVTERLLFTMVETMVGIAAIGVYVLDAFTVPLVLTALINAVEIIMLNKILKA